MKSSFVRTSDGVRLHYLEDGAGPPMLFIPGFTAPAHIWNRQIRHYSKNHRVVAIDPRSHGESDKPSEGHYPARMARDIHQAIQQLKLMPLVAVAWAFACSQMLEYVAQQGTSHLRGLVLVDGYVGREPTFEQVMSYLRSALAMQQDREAHAREFVRSWFVQPHGDDYLDQLIQDSMKCPTNSAVAMVASWETLANQADILADIDVPLMYVAIEEKRRQAEIVRQQAPTARIEFVEQAGHALFVDQADRFNELLDEFTERCVKQTG